LKLKKSKDMERETTVVLVLLCFVSLILHSLSHDRRFVVSSYSKEGTSDVRLMTYSHKGAPRLFSELFEGNNPSYFTIADKRILYFINEVPSFIGREGGGVSMARVTKRDFESVVGSAMNQRGGGPCFITRSHDKKYLLTANYGGGSVSVVRIASNKTPGEVTDTVFFDHADSLASHPHMILYNPSKDLYYVTDLGLDRVFVFKLDVSTGKLKPAAVPFFEVAKGSGPRHMVMNGRKSILYIVNELNSTVSVFDITGERPAVLQTVNALPKDYKGINASGDICLSRSGRYLYITNRGSNTIGVFRVSKGGMLELAGHVSCGGDWPRNMALDKSGRRMIICNQRSGDLAFFRINRRTGLPIKEDYSYKLNAPSCVKFIE
jgi:6-phosphogluconolactonase